jgi:hypothetical protein
MAMTRAHLIFYSFGCSHSCLAMFWSPTQAAIHAAWEAGN